MNKLKELLPFLFPLAAIILVVVLGFRWYRLRDQQMGQISEFAEGVEIENLSEQELEDVSQGVEDLDTVEMERSAEDVQALGEIRYQYDDQGRVRFSVMGTLPELETGKYQVWLKDPAGDAVKKAFVLEMSKGGYIGSAAISQDALPFEVVVSKEETDDDQMEEEILRGRIEEVNSAETQVEPTSNTLNEIEES